MEKKEEFIGREIKCLDKGFIRLVDYMGDDSSIVQAARVSYGKGTKTKRADRELIRYLIRHRHTSPFEMVEFKFHVKLPIFVARQWIRHRTANVNEYSGRYSEMKDEFYLPDIEQIRPQSTSNRQGRGEQPLEEEQAKQVLNIFEQAHELLYKEYKWLLSIDLARELARINLPLSTYTEWYWKIDLHNLLHFLKLRLDLLAQYEIRQYAKAIMELIEPIVPVTIEAFRDYLLDSLSFSVQELRVIRDLLKGRELSNELLSEHKITGLEAEEFQEKLNKLLN